MSRPQNVKDIATGLAAALKKQAKLCEKYVEDKPITQLDIDDMAELLTFIAGKGMGKIMVLKVALEVASKAK